MNQWTEKFLCVDFGEYLMSRSQVFLLGLSASIFR